MTSPSTRLLPAALLLGAVLGADPAAADAPAGTFSAEEWRSRQGRWRFEPSGEVVCEGASYSSMLERRKVSARDLDFSVEVRFLGPDSSAALYFRARGKGLYDDMTFYQLEWYTRGRHHGRRLSLMTKSPPWRWKQIVTPLERDAPLDQWIVLRVRARGEQLEAFVDGVRVFEKRDRTWVRSGSLGLHVFQPRRVRFRMPRLRAR